MVEEADWRQGFGASRDGSSAALAAVGIVKSQKKIKRGTNSWQTQRGCPDLFDATRLGVSERRAFGDWLEQFDANFGSFVTRTSAAAVSASG